VNPFNGRFFYEISPAGFAGSRTTCFKEELVGGFIFPNIWDDFLQSDELHHFSEG
jgi:hypothetical protein